MDKYVAYVIVSLAMIVLDSVWIMSNKDSYFSTIRSIQGGKEVVIKPLYALIAYIIMIFSIIFVTIPFTLHHVTVKDTLATKLYKSVLYGGSVGFSIYGIYNFTCLALFDKYALSVGIKDTIWGTFLYSLLTFTFVALIHPSVTG
jgi:uncharacterized membrane protein